MAVLAAVWLAALAGGVAGAVELTGDGDAVRSASPPVSSPQPPGAERAAAGRTAFAGDRVPMSFGAASVGSVLRVTGSDDVLGMRVGAGQRAYQVHLTLLNLRDRAITFAPSRVTLHPRRSVGAVEIATGSAVGGRIDARSPHRYAIRFVSGATGELPVVRLRDPGTGRSHTIALGMAEGLKTLDVAAHHSAQGTSRRGGRTR